MRSINLNNSYHIYCLYIEYRFMLFHKLLFSYKAIMKETTNKVSMASQKYSEIIEGWLLTKTKFLDSMILDIQYNDKYDKNI